MVGILFGPLLALERHFARSLGASLVLDLSGKELFFLAVLESVHPRRATLFRGCRRELGSLP